MPVYTYVCPQCQAPTTSLQRIADRDTPRDTAEPDEPLRCTECGTQVERTVDTPSFRMTGVVY
jgi:putative FmdB family regulatory protein